MGVQHLEPELSATGPNEPLICCPDVNVGLAQKFNWHFWQFWILDDDNSFRSGGDAYVQFGGLSLDLTG
jgi:hypothetical protein